MAKSKGGFYAVAKGRTPGVYTTWDECNEEVKGFAGARYKKFASFAEAQAFVGGSASTNGNNNASSPQLPDLATRTTSTKPGRTEPYPRPSTLERRGPIKMTSNEEITKEEEGWDVVYSDGACKGNGQVGSIAGVGVWWGYNDPRNISERCPGGQTNNRAELIAIVRVLETTPTTSKPLMIKTDSKYSIQCLTEWFPRWLANNFIKRDGAPVLNAPLLRYLAALLELRATRKQKVKFVYVKGHAGIEGNEGADRQANLGATMEERAERDWDAEREKIRTTIDVERKGVVKVRIEVDADEEELWDNVSDLNFDEIDTEALEGR